MAFPLPAGDPMGDALRVCGLDSAQAHRAIVQGEGFQTLANLSEMDAENVAEMIKRMALRVANANGYIMPTFNTLRFRALVWWANDLRTRNQPIVGFDVNTLTATQAKMRVMAGQKVAEPLDKPPIFTP